MGIHLCFAEDIVLASHSSRLDWPTILSAYQGTTCRTGIDWAPVPFQTLVRSRIQNLDLDLFATPLRARIRGRGLFQNPSNSF
jgi:hypothetical protein